jgi:hypothetical protein
MVPNKS